MKIIFATEPIKYPLTGIGRYSLELVKRLAVAREIEELKLFHGASFIDQIPPGWRIKAIPKPAIMVVCRRFCAASRC